MQYRVNDVSEQTTDAVFKHTQNTTKYTSTYLFQPRELINRLQHKYQTSSLSDRCGLWLIDKEGIIQANCCPAEADDEPVAPSASRLAP